MNSKTKVILGLIVFAIFLGIAYTSYSSLSERYTANQENRTSESDSTPSANGGSSNAASEKTPKQEEKKSLAPDFTVYGTDGIAYKLSDFHGKPVVINFWASWCPPCREEMPHFNDAYAKYKNDVVFLMIDLVDGQRETEKSAQKFIKEQGYDFPIYFDNNNKAASIYGISSIPTTLFIDGEGYLSQGYMGPVTKSVLEKEIERLK